MSTGEETKEQILPAEPELKQSCLADIPILPMIKLALEKHRRDLPELMKKHADQWVAYHGDERLEIGRSPQKLYRKYLDRGLSRDEFIVLAVEPELTDDPDQSDSSPEPKLERSCLADIPILPMIQKALDRHRRDLPELMKKHANQWVAYHGDERLEFGRSKQKLFFKYLDRGLSPDELIVLAVEPELPDELDPSEWAHV